MFCRDLTGNLSGLRLWTRMCSGRIYVLRKVGIGTTQNCLAQRRNSHFVAQSGNSYFAQDNSEIVSAQSKNRDKVRIIRC